MYTIVTEVVKHNHIQGTESLTYCVWVGKDLDDQKPKYCYPGIKLEEKARTLANKIHHDQHTHDILWVSA
jgi:hypothetical protein